MLAASFTIVHFNFHECSELTSIFTSIFTSESSVIVVNGALMDVDLGDEGVALAVGLNSVYVGERRHGGIIFSCISC